MERLQFTLPRLLLATGLIGAGLGSAGLVVGHNPLTVHQGVLMLAAVPLTVAGVFALFGRCRLGFYFGFFGQIIVVLAVAIFLVGWTAVEHWSIRFAIAMTAFVILLVGFVIIRKARDARLRRSDSGR